LKQLIRSSPSSPTTKQQILRSRKLAAAGLEMKNLSVVGKGYHTDEKVVGFYNAGDRIQFWGK
jgi:hypothetical protein